MQYTAIGINENRDLIIGNDTSGALFLVLFPLIGPGGPGYWEPDIFERIN